MLARVEGEFRRAVGYLRVSTLEQQQHGLSLDAQRRRIIEAAPAYGYSLSEIFSDSVSGTVAPHKREGLAAALDLLRRGDAACLVVSKLDRLSRRTIDALKLIERADKERWQVVSLSEQLDSATPGGRFVTTVLAAFAEMERGQIAERTRLGMAQVKAEGRGRSRRLPFGFRVEGKPELVTLAAGDRGRLVPHESEQQLLQVMMRLQGSGLGGWAIASTLNRNGAFNPRTGRPWSVGGVRSILRTARTHAPS